jgi:hypothetical protein
VVDTRPDSAAIAQAAAAPRAALALGMVGALGEALLAALVASSGYSIVHLAVVQPLGSGTPRLRPWIVGDGVVIADDAFICLTDAALPVAKGSPLARYAPEKVLDAARIAREAGVRRLVLVAPLTALLQLNASAHTLASADELALTEMGFDTVLIVRPTLDPPGVGAGWMQATLRAATRAVRDIMLPGNVQPLRAQTAAGAILEAARRAPPGVHVLGAAALATIVEQTGAPNTRRDR